MDGTIQGQLISFYESTPEAPFGWFLKVLHRDCSNEGLNLILSPLNVGHSSCSNIDIF